AKRLPQEYNRYRPTDHLDFLPSRPRRESPVPTAPHNVVCRSQMPSCLTTIALAFIAVDARVRQQPIQERAAAGAGFTVNDANRFPGKIFYFPQPLGISPADNEPFFPMGESND